MEIRLVCDDSSTLAAMFSTWCSVRRLPTDMQLPFACMLMKNEHSEQMGSFSVCEVDQMMTQLFPLLERHLDPELLKQCNELERQRIADDGGHLYEPAVRKYLERIGEFNLASIKIE